MKRIEDGKRILIYGAHLVAAECCRYLISLGLKEKLLGFAVTSMEDNPKELEKFPVKEIGEYKEYASETTVIIATPLRFHESIKAHLAGCGFNAVESMGLEELSVLKGKRIVDSMAQGKFSLCESMNDPTWLNAKDAKGATLFKFPTLYYLGLNELWDTVNLESPMKLYGEELGHLIRISDLPNVYSDDCRPVYKIINIYMAFGAGQRGIVEKSWYTPWIKPLLVGAHGKGAHSDVLSDDSYEGNLSHLNPLLAEMTGVHWIWKKSPPCRYKGLCHYRRHFILNEKDISAILETDIDALLTIPRYAPGGVKNMFLAETPVKTEVFDNLHKAMESLNAEDCRDFFEYIDGCFYFPNNMAVAKSEIYEDYCGYMFPILLGMREESYGHETDRHIAYAAELLTSYYFMKKRKGLKIAVTNFNFLWKEF